MVLKEKKLAILIYLLRYGRMTRDECSNCLNLYNRTLLKDWTKLLEIPGIYSDKEKSILFSFYYIISHQIPTFYDHTGKQLFLKDVKTRSPVDTIINSSSNITLRASFS